MESITQYALETVSAVAVTIITVYLVPFIKGRLAQVNGEKLDKLIDKAVQAAEQTIRGSGMGAERKAWVVALLGKTGVIVDDMVDAMIEAAVKAMNDAVTKLADTAVEAIENIDAEG
jgi:hypothetical protein